MSSSESFEELFDKTNFIKHYIKRDGSSNSTDKVDTHDFLNSFLDTQMYQMFIEDRVWPSERNFEVSLLKKMKKKLIKL